MQPNKIIGVVLIAIAIGISFTGAGWMASLILGAFGIGLFFWG